MGEFITTMGSGAVWAEPDAMRVSIGVETAASTVAEALAKVVEAGRRAGEAARRHTDPYRVSSQGFRVRPSRDHHGRPDGYLASHDLEVLCGLAAAGELVSDLGEQVGDALRVHRVDPVVTDTGELLVRTAVGVYGGSVQGRRTRCARRPTARPSPAGPRGQRSG